MRFPDLIIYTWGGDFRLKTKDLIVVGKSMPFCARYLLSGFFPWSVTIVILSNTKKWNLNTMASKILKSDYLIS